MTGRIATSLAADPSPRVRAAVVVDRWLHKQFDATFELGDGDLFELALRLQRETDYLEYRHRFELPIRLIHSPFENVKRAARRRLLGRYL